MRRLVVIWAMCGLPLALQAQVPRLDPTAGRAEEDTSPAMSKADSANLHGRTTAAMKPFSQCAGSAFQTCASGETSARKSLDGTAYGVLISVFDDRKGIERTAFLWRITGRVSVGGVDGGAGGRQRGGGRRGGGGGGGGGRTRRGG